MLSDERTAAVAASPSCERAAAYQVAAHLGSTCDANLGRDWSESAECPRWRVVFCRYG